MYMSRFDIFGKNQLSFILPKIDFVFLMYNTIISSFLNFFSLLSVLSRYFSFSLFYILCLAVFLSPLSGPTPLSLHDNLHRFSFAPFAPCNVSSHFEAT